jgi:uncharacterized protein YggE
MKNCSIFFSLILLVILASCGGNPVTLPPAQPSAAAAARSITVTGNAVVMVVPDEVVLTLGIETSDILLQPAKAMNDTIVNKVMDVTRSMQIDPKYVQTDYLNLEPRYEYSNNKQIFNAYYVRKNVVITLKDITRFEELLSGVLEAGVNYIHGIDFRTTELRTYRDQARSLAVKAAQEKAQLLAKELGQTIGSPISIREDYNRWWYPWNSWWGSAGGNGMAQNVVQNAGGTAPSDEPTSLAPGQISVSASVSVDFELK